jgi:hypothetical protein
MTLEMIDDVCIVQGRELKSVYVLTHGYVLPGQISGTLPSFPPSPFITFVAAWY